MWVSFEKKSTDFNSFVRLNKLNKIIENLIVRKFTILREIPILELILWQNTEGEDMCVSDFYKSTDFIHLYEES